MMNFPSLPTDNLYKFSALAGLVLSVVFFVWPTLELAKLDQQRVQVRTEASLFELELKHLEDDIKQLKEGGPEPVSDAERKELRAKVREVALKEARLQGSHELLDSLFDSFNRVWVLLKVGGALSVLLTIPGFFLWYVRVQKPADLKLQQELKGTRSDA